MPGDTLVTLTVPLTIPLSLANAIEAQADSEHISIAELLSCQLLKAANEYAAERMANEELSRLAGQPFAPHAADNKLTISAIDGITPPDGVELSNGHA